MDNEKLEILKFLIEHKTEEYSIRQISKERRINYKSAYQNINKLEHEGCISVKKKGNISLCSFNGVFCESVFLVETQRKNYLLKNRDFKIIHDRLKKINQQFILLLFGSHAKKTSTKKSDIDLLLVCDKEQKIEDQLELIPLIIHLTAVNYEEFMEMLKTKNKNVVDEANKENIILFGTEDYYRLLENAR